jgi:hypothetical protein
LITTLIFDGCPLIVAIVVAATSKTSRGAITGGDKETREQHLTDAPESSIVKDADCIVSHRLKKKMAR